MPALSIKNLQKTYSNGLQALKGVDLLVKEGDFFALLGPNGAGKSTIIGILCSLINKTSGTVTVFDCDIDKDWALAKSYMGVVPQEFNFSIFETVHQVVANQAGYFGLSPKKAAENTEIVLKEVGLWDKRNDRTLTLSGGMKRRLMIARALVHKPKLLILDEPTAGVDIEIRRSMWEYLCKINAAGTTIILTTHYLEEAESLCRNLAIIDHGLIIEHGKTKELLTRLNTHCYLLDMRAPITAPIEIPGMDCKIVDDNCLEITLPSNSNVNAIFDACNAHGLEVASMRNKTNRLEELFWRLTRHEQQAL